MLIVRFDVQLQVITDEHLRHLVAMETDEPDSAADVDEKLAALDRFHRLSAVSCIELFVIMRRSPVVAYDTIRCDEFACSIKLKLMGGQVSLPNGNKAEN